MDCRTKEEKKSSLFKSFTSLPVEMRRAIVEEVAKETETDSRFREIYFPERVMIVYGKMVHCA